MPTDAAWTAQDRAEQRRKIAAVKKARATTLPPQFKAGPSAPDADGDIARQRRDYYRKHPEQDTQSFYSKVLEMFGLDEPYRDDSGSYDYRQQAWDESVAKGSPDVSWFLPEFSDEQVAAAGSAIEPALGFLPDMVENNPLGLRFGEKRDPFPESMKGTRERPGNKASGALAHVLDQWNWSPWDTGDILSFLGPDSPTTVRADIDAWKGGSSTMDRTFGGVPEGQEPTTNPFVDPVEIGSAALYLGLPGALYRGSKAVAKGGRKIFHGVKRLATKGRAPLTTTAATVGDNTMPSLGRLLRGKGKLRPKPFRDPLAPPGKIPIAPLSPKPSPPYTENATVRASRGGTVRDETVRRDIMRSIEQQSGRPNAAGGAAIGAGLVGAGAYMGNEALKRKRKY